MDQQASKEAREPSQTEIIFNLCSDNYKVAHEVREAVITIKDFILPSDPHKDDEQTEAPPSHCFLPRVIEDLKRLREVQLQALSTLNQIKKAVKFE